MKTPICIALGCNLAVSCQRWKDVEEPMEGRSTYVPLMPFLVSLENPDGPFNGCADYWPVGTGPEYFMENVERKTPISNA